MTQPHGHADDLSSTPAAAPVNINDVLLNLPPAQLAEIDFVRLYELHLQNEQSARAELEAARLARGADRGRLIVFSVLIALMAIEFAIGAAILVWSNTRWDEIKDLLAYGVAPLSAAVGFAAGHYFPASPSSG